ncbi:hypothetical protein CDAR_269591 [Caerostris darwini]|uniref:Uncharacterized protein n=1 Tax=Caerostris darwini TaxID=1538125 RepID=A0AAV4WPN8_9ARAC|nr:hypothetical protein CDAR_269591 [Caerostris darwini]
MNALFSDAYAYKGCRNYLTSIISSDTGNSMAALQFIEKAGLFRKLTRNRSFGKPCPNISNQATAPAFIRPKLTNYGAVAEDI